MMDFYKSIEARLSLPLPGVNAHKKLVPFYREAIIPDKNLIKEAKKAATLLLIYKKEEKYYFVVIERVSYDGVHSGQISFPGGKQEQEDTSFEQTALRETEEEIGIVSKKVNILGKLTNIYIPPSNFYVYPYVGYYKERPLFKRQESEVENIIEIPLEHLKDENRIVQIEQMTSLNSRFKVPTFQFDSCSIWGATAIILSEFADILKGID